MTPSERAEPYIAGVPMSSIARWGWGSLHTKTILTGDDEATWSFLKPSNRVLSRHPALVYGAPVDIKIGPCVIAAGVLTEPDWDAGTLTMVGAPHEAEAALCFNGSGQTTTKPNTAADQAITRGAIGWTRVGDFGTAAIGNADDATSGLTYLDQLLNAWADQANAGAGSGWAITPRRELVVTGAPVAGAPRWFIAPDSGVLGQADDSRIDRVFVRYVSTASGNPLATASYPATTPLGGREAGVNITTRGPVAPTTAANIAKGIWSRLQGQSGWTNSLTLDRSQITTPGGAPARLEFVRAWDTVRLLGVHDPRSTAHHLDVVIGATDLDHDADSIQLDLVGLAARSLEDVLKKNYPNDGFTAL